MQATSALIPLFLIGLAYVGYRDWTDFRIPDHATLPLAVAGVVWIITVQSDQWLAHALAGLIGGALFVAIGQVYRKLRSKDGLGLGDAKLVAVGGLWLGPALPVAIAIGTGIALAVTVGLIAAKRRSFDDPIPLGAFLCIGFAIALLI